MKTTKCLRLLQCLLLAAVISVFGCGGGGGGSKDGGVVVPHSYTGKTSPATITTANVSSLVNTAWVSLRTSVDIGEAIPIDVSGTILGDCGGTAITSIAIDDSTGIFSGTISFIEYCTMGTTLDGAVTFSGQANQTSMVLTQLKLTFNNLDISDDSGSYTFIEGHTSYVVKQDLSAETNTFDLVIRDNTQQKTYWLNDYTLEISYGGLEDMATIKGKFYDYDNGYIELGTVTPLTISDGGPSGGVLLFSGIQSYAKLTFNPDLSTLLELDANSDGNFVPIRSLTFVRQFLQFRTFENSASNHFAAFVDYKANGELLQPGEMLTARIYDPSNLKLSTTLLFVNNRFTYAAWNPTLSQFTEIGTDGDSGFLFDLSSYTDLAAGTYRVEVDAVNGDLLTSTLNYPGKSELPAVTAAGMNFQWNPDGSLTLSWNEPTGSFQQYRVVLTDQDNLGIFYGRVLPGVNQVTLQTALVAQIFQLSSPTQVNWTMQTRNYSGDDNYARGYSNSIMITLP